MQGIMIFFLLFHSLILGCAINSTIDNSFGDSQTGQLVTDLPSNSTWDNETCVGCALQPDINLAFDKTYTDATWTPTSNGTMSITMKLNGKFLSPVKLYIEVNIYQVLPFMFSLSLSIKYRISQRKL
jgi:hypothetical protein